MGSLSPWHLAILLAVMILLFGAKKLPDAARGLGRSLKILKAETKGLREEEDESGARASGATSPDSKQLTDGGTSTTAENATDDQKVAELQQQLDELKRQQDQTHKNAS